MKALIVDDNVDVQDIIRDIAEAEGCLTRVASTVDEALEKMSGFYPDVVFLDMWVGDVDGLSLITRAKESFPALTFNVILLTSPYDKVPTDVPEVRGHIMKPFKTAEVVGALYKVSSPKSSHSSPSRPRKRLRDRVFGRKEPKIEMPTAAPEDSGARFGESYVVLKADEDSIYKFAGLFSPSDYSLMIITSDSLKAVKERFGYGNIEVRIMSAKPPDGMFDITGLGSTVTFLRDYVNDHDNPVIVFDDFNAIVKANGINDSMRMIHLLLRDTEGKDRTIAISVKEDKEISDHLGILLHDMKLFTPINRGRQMKIEKVWAREVLDSRGNPTVEAEVTVGGHKISAIAPSGASTGSWEALELRDGSSRYGGKGVLKAVENVRGEIAKRITGMDPSDQRAVDEAMIGLDGTNNKSRLGGNATVAVSLAVAKAGAMCEGIPVYKHIGGDHVTLPVPMLNIINGGKHAGGNLKIQECMIIPAGAKSFSECLRASSEIYMHLKSILKSKYGLSAVNIGDEGGFAPPLDTVDEALSTIVSAISDAGYSPGKDVFLAIDAASSEFYADGKYDVDGMRLSAGELMDHYVELTKAHPLVSIEDPFFEDDFETTAELTRKIGSKVQIVGDDLFVTNSRRLSKGISEGAANALLLKVNQIGTVTESEDAAKMSFEHGYNVVVSHRSGESEDVTIADLSVGWGSGEIKTGAPARGERTAKYNRLLRIEEELGSEGRFPGLSKFRV
ncbi:MAG: phosphopyruvate hydratase [Candidatus Methanomethylophilaceae archaeon]|nr:phosphopyruvate hydratase [Candidatus Methanomethylophilaceae archaeon]